MKIFTTFFYLILIVVGVSFAALNSSFVEVNFYFSKINLPISVLIILSLGFGLFLGFIIYTFRYLRLKSDYRRMQSQLRITEQEIKNLRTIPVTDNYTGFGEH